MRKLLTIFILSVALGMSVISCEEEHEHTAPAVNPRDSVPVMVTYGVNTLISDSGVIKYRLVTERWEVNEAKKPSRWVFDKGVLMSQFDEKLHIKGYIQCDSAVYFDKLRKWELHGRVRILTTQGLEFTGDELFWDEQNHKFWSNTYSHMKMPDKEIDGNYFTSNEDMTQYEIKQTHGKLDRNRSDFGRNTNSTSNQPAAPALASKDSLHVIPLNGPHPVGANKPKFQVK